MPYRPTDIKERLMHELDKIRNWLSWWMNCIEVCIPKLHIFYMQLAFFK